MKNKTKTGVGKLELEHSYSHTFLRWHSHLVCVVTIKELTSRVRQYVPAHGLNHWPAQIPFQERSHKQNGEPTDLYKHRLQARYMTDEQEIFPNSHCIYIFADHQFPLIQVANVFLKLECY